MHSQLNLHTLPRLLTPCLDRARCHSLFGTCRYEDMVRIPIAMTSVCANPTFYMVSRTIACADIATTNLQTRVHNGLHSHFLSCRISVVIVLAFPNVHFSFLAIGEGEPPRIGVTA
jgi:hypothetical protein